MDDYSKERAIPEFNHNPDAANSLAGDIGNRYFCHGAILCQHGKASAKDIAKKSEKNIDKGVQGNIKTHPWTFICQYCSLEVANYKSLRLQSTGVPLDITDLLASCHLMACNLKDLRAFYRCLPCHLDQRLVDFATAAELERHMNNHTDFTFLPSRLLSAGREAAKQDIEQYFVNAQPTATDPAGSARDVDEEVSSPSTPSNEAASDDVSSADESSEPEAILQSPLFEQDQDQNSGDSTPGSIQDGEVHSGQAQELDCHEVQTVHEAQASQGSSEDSPHTFYELSVEEEPSEMPGSFQI